MDVIHESFVTTCLLWLYANISHPLLLILIIFSSIFLILLILIIAIVIILSLVWLYVRSTFSLSALILYLIEAIEHLYPPQFLLRLRRRVYEPPIKSPPPQTKPKALFPSDSLILVEQQPASVQKRVMTKQLTNDTSTHYKVTPKLRTDDEGRVFMNLTSRRVSRSPSEARAVIRYRDYAYAKLCLPPFHNIAKFPTPKLTKVVPKALSNQSSSESSRLESSTTSVSSALDRTRVLLSDNENSHNHHEESDDGDDPNPRCFRCHRPKYPDMPVKSP